MSHNDGTSTLPRDFRYREPRTPEPHNNELRQPSPPRHRLKIRKRHSSTLQAPTQQFLASVAAADAPIPTIEIPQFSVRQDNYMAVEEEEMAPVYGLLAPRAHNLRGASPPRTPIPTLPSEPGRSHLPDWSRESRSPIEEGFFERPQSAHSNTSDSSENGSFYSEGRHYRHDDDGSCTSPDSDREDPFQFPVTKGKGKGKAMPDPFVQPTILNGDLRSKARNDAPWTNAQSNHVWAIYLLYLQDPTVTPFRIGARAVPPEGVCHRVAREVRRSWKGPRAAGFGSRVSENATPTPTSSKVYASWPHSSAATRSHLRELCRSKDNTAVSYHRHRQSRSPTPFTKPDPRSRMRTPEPQRPTFDVKDMNLVLATSTAESMRPDGPLAKLATSGSPTKRPDMESPFPHAEGFRPSSFSGSRSLAIDLDGAKDDCLGSPFVARTYGPSSSKNFSFNEYRPSAPRNLSYDGPRLRSPLMFDHSRSLNGTQKRRAQHDLDEELSPNGAIVRPSILNEQLFGTPLNARRVRSRGFSLGDEAFRRQSSGIFQPGFDFAPPPQMDLPSSKASPVPSTAGSTLIPPPSIDPPRLGSPFSESQTFPRRLFPEGTATIRKSAFATMHQSRRSIESFDFGAEGPSLQSRLQNVENKLRLIREREAAAKHQS
jgi:hypothetical protein